MPGLPAALGACLLFCLLLGAMVGVARAEEGLYVAGRTGVVMLGDFEDVGIDRVREIDFTRIEFDTGFGFMGAVGYDFGILRLEGEFGYSKSDLDKVKFGHDKVSAGGDVTDMHLLLNAYADLDNPTDLVPYVGAGIGVSYTSANGVSVEDVTLLDDGTGVLAYQVSGGVGYKMTGSVMLELGYRYFATADPDFTDELGLDVNVEHSSHSLTLGLRITF